MTCCPKPSNQFYFHDAKYSNQCECHQPPNYRPEPSCVCRNRKPFHSSSKPCQRNRSCPPDWRQEFTNDWHCRSRRQSCGRCLQRYNCACDAEFGLEYTNLHFNNFPKAARDRYSRFNREKTGECHEPNPTNLILGPNVDYPTDHGLTITECVTETVSSTDSSPPRKRCCKK